MSPLISPPTYDFWSRQLGSTHAWSRCYARVVDRTVEAKDTLTLRLLPNGNFEGFIPGQHVNVTADIDGRRVTRSYSFSNVPSKDRWVEITVRRDPNGRMSSWLFQQAKRGSVVELEAVFGDMTAQCFADQPLVFLAGGSGITPLMSLLREAASTSRLSDLTLVYWERHENRVCFSDELRSLAQHHPGFTLHTVITHQDPRKRVSARQLAELGVQIEGAQVLACGSGAFVHQARSCTVDAASSVHSEAFTPWQRTAANSSTERFCVELIASNRQIEVDGQDTLLDALEKQGVAVQTGCRMGVCNTCACQKIAGRTEAVDGSSVDSATYTNVRLCVTKATSDLQLNL